MMSHVRIAPTQAMLNATRVAAGEANLVLGCDVLTTTAEDSALAKMAVGVTKAVINSAVMPAHVHQERRSQVPARQHGARDQGSLRRRRRVVPRCDEANALMGDSIATNLFVLGYQAKAWCRCLKPRSQRAIRATAPIEMKQESRSVGRRAPSIPHCGSHRCAKIAVASTIKLSNRSPDEMVERRTKFLTDYRDAAYAKTYSDFGLRSSGRARETAKTALTGSGRTAYSPLAGRRVRGGASAQQR